MGNGWGGSMLKAIRDDDVAQAEAALQDPQANVDAKVSADHWTDRHGGIPHLGVTKYWG